MNCWLESDPIHLLEMFPNVTIDETANADYPFRIIISREFFANALEDNSLNIYYDNFKSSIDDNDFHKCCVEIWAIIHRYGLNQRYLDEGYLRCPINQQYPSQSCEK